jgi:hypothetical protein
MVFCFCFWAWMNNFESNSIIFGYTIAEMTKWSLKSNIKMKLSLLIFNENIGKFGLIFITNLKLTKNSKNWAIQRKLTGQKYVLLILGEIMHHPNEKKLNIYIKCKAKLLFIFTMLYMKLLNCNTCLLYIFDYAFTLMWPFYINITMHKKNSCIHIFFICILYAHFFNFAILHILICNICISINLG